MTYNCNTKATPSGFIQFLEFYSEEKSEEKCAFRMNKFYSDIIDEALKITDKNGVKCFIDISAFSHENGITVSFSYTAKKHGRFVHRFCDKRMWKNGVIVSA